MKKIKILLCTMAMLAVTALAWATCPLPTGSSGGNGWNGGATQGYFKDVSLNPVDHSSIIWNWCDISTNVCTQSTTTFNSKVVLNPIAGNWHGSQAFPLRFVSFTNNICGGGNWCMTLAGDVDMGDHINPLQNSVRWVFDSTKALPITTDPTYIEAPLGHWIVKVAGMGATIPQTLRFNYVNSTNTGIATRDVFFGPMSCP